MKRPQYKYEGPRCGKLVKCILSDTPVPCDANLNHRGRHIPKLQGIRDNGNLCVQERAPDYKVKKGGNQTMWYVTDRQKPVKAISLLQKTSRNIRVPAGSNSGTKMNGKRKPEYATWRHHVNSILNPKAVQHNTYRGMPVHPDWNPKNFIMPVQAYYNFEKWLKSPDGIGLRPSTVHSMDVIKHHLGFSPGNLRWTCKKTQSRNQRYLTMFLLTVEQHRTALLPLGYKLVKIKKAKNASTP